MVPATNYKYTTDKLVASHIYNREYFKPLGGKIFRRYPKEE